MALRWNSKVRELSTALADIGELKSTLADTLTSNGFSDVRHTAEEVAGGKNGCWLSVNYFYLGDRNFHEMVMCCGDPDGIAQGIVNEVVSLIDNMKFL